MSDSLIDVLRHVTSGEVVPYLGPGALFDVVHTDTKKPIPADSDSLILAMNGGKPMAPKLMFEFPRAAMSVELKRGRSSVNRFLTETYDDHRWTLPAIHQWIAAADVPYAIDINRDISLQRLYDGRPHTLVIGISRIGGTDYRFQLHAFDGGSYRQVSPEEADPSLPILFKPMGTPRPIPSYIASDADYVDYLTELMGGFGVPAFVKEHRLAKRYLFLGVPFTRDTERMVASDLIFAATTPAGWAVLPQPTDKERRYCRRMNLDIIEASMQEVAESMLGLAATA